MADADEPMMEIPASRAPLGNPAPALSIPPSPSHIANPKHVPRLSIGYLLTWTAVTAAVLAGMQAEGSFGRSGAVSGWAMLLMPLFAAAVGWLLFGSMLLAWHTVRCTKWPLEPGEWLILVLTNAVVVCLAMIVWERYAWRVVDKTDPYSYETFHALQSAIQFRRWIQQAIPGEIAVVMLAAALAQRRRPVWCAALVVMATGVLSIYLPIFITSRYRHSMPKAMVSQYAHPFLFWSIGLFNVIGLVSLALMAGGVVLDRMRRQPRHWLHWSGVGLSSVAIAGSLTLVTLALIFGW